MVAIQDVRAINEEFFRNRSLVAVLVGGTSGIGEYTVRALAAIYSTQKASLRLYIVGRKNAAAEKIIADCSRICSNGAFYFVKAEDLALLNEVDRVSTEILRLEEQHHRDDKPRIDMLIMTQGQVVFGPRRDPNYNGGLTVTAETIEGLDRTMSLIYYSRIRFIIKLMPLLLAAPDTAHVVAVYAAGLEGKLFRGDLSLRDPKHYGQIIVRSHNTHMTTMAFEHLAKQHQRVSLVHVFPGVVITPSYADPTFPMWFKILWRLLGPFVRRFQAISPEESSSRTLILGTSRFPARQDNNSVPRSGKTKIAQGTDGSLGSGAYAVGNDSEAVNLKADYEKLREEGFENTVWDHTMKAFSDIEAGRAFAE